MARQLKRVYVSDDFYSVLKKVSDDNNMNLVQASTLIGKKIKNEKKDEKYWEYFKL